MELCRRERTAGGVVRTLLLGVLGIILAGCYVSEREVIGASRAVAVPGLVGDYDDDDGATTSIVAVPYSNDFRFRRVSKDGDVSTGSLRVIPLRGDIYLTQVKYDDDEAYLLLFYEFVVGDEVRYSAMEADVDFETLERLARDHGAILDTNEDMAYTLAGDSGSILDFLLAHRDLPMSYDVF